MSDCGNCGVSVADVFAKRSGGFCYRCEYMTKPEAIERLHISKSSFDRMLSDGTIKGVRPTPGRVLIRRVQVEAILHQFVAN